jgi:6,7-dimethyl-8-ribityllumazine synthase
LATYLKNLSKHDASKVPSTEDMRFAILVSEWNPEITGALRDGAVKTLRKYGVSKDDIVVRHVPGTFELTVAAKWMAERCEFDGIICLGCVIRGETPHFDYVCQAVTQGLTALNVQLGIPFVFGVLTTDNLEQAQDRAGGKHGNKGIEAAVTAIKMAALQREVDIVDEQFLDELLDELGDDFDDDGFRGPELVN